MNIFAKLQLKWKLVAGFAIPLVLIVTIATTVYFSLGKLLETSKVVQNTYELTRLSDEISISLINMETGLRGFLLVGKDEFLEPLKVGKKEFEKLTAAAKKTGPGQPHST